MKVNDVAVIIPAYKPDEKLLGTLDNVVKQGFDKLLVVDDGSGAEFENIFDEVKKIPECILLRHPVNKGKGAALKTAFSYVLDNMSDIAGVVTADADGQHLAKDICAVSEEMVKSGKVILGVRDFSDPTVPARSKTGNRITSAVFKIFFGMKISDTQTGLRAFPLRYIKEISEADGDRYEFETNMLFLMNKNDIPYGEVKIATVYIEENKSSHFRVVRDSIRIYGLIIKYLFSAVAALLIDLGVFHVLNLTNIFSFLGNAHTVGPQLIARVVSSICNYMMNAKIVFKDKMNRATLVKYYSLAVVQFIVGAGSVAVISYFLKLADHKWLELLVNLLVQMIIYPISFRIQHKWVFNEKNKEKKSK